MIVMSLGALTITHTQCAGLLVWGSIAWRLGVIAQPRLRYRTLILLMTGACIVGVTSSTPVSVGALAGSLLMSQMMPATWHTPLGKRALLRCCLWPQLLAVMAMHLLSWLYPPPQFKCDMTLPTASGRLLPIIGDTPRVLILWRDDCRWCRWMLAHMATWHSDHDALLTVNQGQSLVQVLRTEQAIQLSMQLDARQSLGARLAINALPAVVFVDHNGYCAVPYQGLEALSPASLQKISRVLDEASRASR